MSLYPSGGRFDLETGVVSTNAAELARNTLERLREDFEAKGYQFLAEPGPTQTPEFLAGHIPDALALGQNDKVIIEIKRQGSREPRIPLAQLAEKVPRGSGWRYMLVYAGQDPSELIDFPRPNQSQVDQATKEARKLEQLGYTRAALLEAWSILEALARRIYPEDIRFSLRPLSPMQIVERLAMDGEIDAEQAKRLRVLSSLRNSAAHGDLDARISGDDVRYLLDVIESVSTHPAD